MKKLFASLVLFSMITGCSSDNDSESSPKKIENPVDTYMDYNKNVMSKPQEVQQQMDKMMQQREKQLQEAENNY